MQLPFTVVVEPPSLDELRRLARRWWIWAIAAGFIVLGVVVLLLNSRPSDDRTLLDNRGPLHVTSDPAGAEVVIDGNKVGRTPVDVTLPPGEHRVIIHYQGYAEATYLPTLTNEPSDLHADLWLRTPQVDRLRPIFPGASIVGAGFLIDGRVVLTVALPPGDERQLWLLGKDGEVERLGPPQARGSIAVSPQGTQAAYLAASDRSAAAGRLTEVWITQRDAERGGRLYTLSTAAADERLVDITWAPDGQHLLLVSRQQPPGGGQRTKLRSLEVSTGAATDLVTLPSDIVVGSYTWSPTGEHVAFLARSGQLTSLCSLDLASGDFHYLADLGRDDASPLPVTPLAWSPAGGQLLYAAPAQDRPTSGGWLFAAKPAPALFKANLAVPVGQRLGKAEGQFPVWRGDGEVLALARPNGSGPLVLRQVDPNGETKDVAELPLKPTSSYAARWDAAHAQLLIAVRGSAGTGTSQTDYFLVQFRPGVSR